MAELARQTSARPRPIPWFAPVTSGRQCVPIFRGRAGRRDLLQITFPAKVICHECPS